MWAAYAAAVLDFGGAAGVGLVDLAQPVDPGLRTALLRLGGGRAFAVVTACDPLGHPASPADNARRTAGLRDELSRAGALLAPVVGRSPDGRHAEPGFACALDRAAAVALARRWEQLALFWFDGERVWLLDACAGRTDTPLPTGAPAADTPPVRVVAAVASRGGRLLVCQRPPDKRHGGLWEFPGGKCEAGETDADAVRRELAEELGVAVTAVGPAAFAVADPGSPFLIAFVPVAVAGDPVCHEHTALAWGTPAELAALPLAPSDRRFVEYLRTTGVTPAPPDA